MVKNPPQSSNNPVQNYLQHLLGEKWISLEALTGYSRVTNRKVARRQRTADVSTRKWWPLSNNGGAVWSNAMSTHAIMELCI
jgi:hypothetical protein